MMLRRLFSGAALALAAAVFAPLTICAPVFAQSDADAEKAVEQRRARYERCVGLARRDAEAARKDAAQWEAVGGGAQAQHCAAIALVALGAPREAAQILTTIGSDAGSGLGPEDRVSMLSLAGELWLQIGRVDLAKRCFDASLKMNPSHRSALIGAAHVAAGADDHASAERLLTQHLNRKADDAEALTFRAAALRLQGKTKKAYQDAKKAAELSPLSAPAWFEKGAAERALDKKSDARESWVKAAMLDLNGQVGEDARHALAVLDVDG